MTCIYIDEFDLARQVMLDPDHVTLTTLADGSRWLTDSYTAANLTTLGLANAFTHLPNGDYTLTPEAPPRPLAAGNPDAWPRDPGGVVTALTDYHQTAATPHPVTATEWALACGEDYQRFLQVGIGELATVSGRLWEGWTEVLREVMYTLDPEGEGWEDWDTGGFTVRAQRTGHGWMLRFVLVDPDRTAGIALTGRPRPIPALPAALTSKAGEPR